MCSLQTHYFSRLIDETRCVIPVVFFVILLYYCHVKAEKNIILCSRQKEKNTDPKRKPAESTTLTKINWVILMNVNLLLNQKPKQQGETFNLPGLKNSSGCDTKDSVSPKKLECPLENCWLGQDVPLKWNPRSETVISPEQTSIYISTFPNALTSKNVQNHVIRIYFSTNSIIALCHTPP